MDVPPRDDRPPRATVVNRRSAEHWCLLLVGLALPLGLLAARLFLDPDPRGFGTHEQLGLWPCRSIALLGIPCPGCGVTTSVVLAVRGRVVESLATQPFGTVAVLLAVVFSAWSLRGHLQGRDLHAALRAKRLTAWWIALTAALALSWIYKLAIT